MTENFQEFPRQFSSRQYNQEDDENLSLLKESSKLNKISKWTLYLSPIIFFIVTLFFLIAIISIRNVQYTSSIEAAENVINYLSHNLRKDPILDIVFNTSTNAKCQENYDEEIIYYWPGISSGCLCSDGSLHNWAYCQLYGECQWIDSVSGGEFYKWNQATVCVKTFRDREWSVVAPGTNCSDGYSLSNYTNFLCLKQGVTDEAVVTGIKAVDYTLTANQTINNYSVFTAGSKLFSKTRTNNTVWITNLTVSFAGTPCLNSADNPEPSTIFELFGINENGCDEYGNASSYDFFLQNETQTQLYTDNNIYNSVIKKIPFYDSFFNESLDYFQLYSESRIALGKNPDCWTLDVQDLSYSSTAVTDALGYVDTYAIIALILTVIGIIITLVQYFAKNIKICKRYICHGTFFVYLIFLLAFVVVLALIIQASLIWKRSTAFSQGVEMNEFYSNLLNEGCFKIQGEINAATNLMNYYNNSFSVVYDLVIFLFVWAIFWIVLFIVCYALRRFMFKSIVFEKPY